MPPPRPFTFDLSFDPEDAPRRRRKAEADPPPAPEPAPPPEPAAPSFSEEEVQAATAAAFADGQAQAQAAALASTEMRLTDAVNGLLRHCDGLATRQRDIDRELSEQAIQIALAVARKLLPEMTRRTGLAEIEAIVRECLVDMIDEPRLVVRVADSQLDPLNDRIDQLKRQAAYTGDIVLMADPNLDPSDARIDWADGGAERISAQLWQRVEDTIGRALDFPTQGSA